MPRDALSSREVSQEHVERCFGPGADRVGVRAQRLELSGYLAWVAENPPIAVVVEGKGGVPKLAEGFGAARLELVHAVGFRSD